jgi:hypothetical protein
MQVPLLVENHKVRARTENTQQSINHQFASPFIIILSDRWRVFKELDFVLENNQLLFCDNQQTIRLLTSEAPKLKTSIIITCIFPIVSQYLCGHKSKSGNHDYYDKLIADNAKITRVC